METYYIRRKAHTFLRALQRKQVTFGFIGGSITDPRPRVRWPEYLMNDFAAAHPNTEVTVENVAIGATGSDYAVFRVEEDLANRNCDIIFIEFAVNDQDEPTEKRMRSREGLIRKIRKHTDCDIAIVYTYSSEFQEAFSKGELPESILEYEELAEYYQCSSVFMSRYAYDACLRGELRYEEWLPDGLHPANVGSRYYAGAVRMLLQDLESDVVDNQNDTGYSGTCEEFPPLNPKNWENAENYPQTEIKRTGHWRRNRVLDQPLVSYVLSSAAPGSSLSLQFHGTGAVITHLFGMNASDFRYRIDDGEWVTVKPERLPWMGDMNWVRTEELASDLPVGEHSLILESLFPEVDGFHNACFFDIVNVGILK